MSDRADESRAAAGPGAPRPGRQRRPTAAVEPPSPDVALADEASPLPGVHRGGFLRLPTAPIDADDRVRAGRTRRRTTSPSRSRSGSCPSPRRRAAGSRAGRSRFSIGGLLVSLFVGWGFPIGLVGIVSAILALRRPLESRAVAVWALVLGIVSVLYSAGWLLFAASRANLLG